MGVTLAERAPAWIHFKDRGGLGLVLDCLTGPMCVMCGGHGRLWVLFSNPLDGGPAYAGDAFGLIWDLVGEAGLDSRMHRGCGGNRWLREGEDLETLSLRPSLNAHECGHLTLTRGVWG